MPTETPLTDDDGLTPDEVTAITRAAGVGAAPPVLSEAGLDLYHQRVEDARWLLDRGIRLVPAWVGSGD